MDSYDCLIVGGGPAGSSCARKLRQGGLNVLVLDKKDFPRNKPCAGWITPQVVQSLQIDESDYRPGRTWQPITGFRCGLIGGPDVEVHYGRPISYGIRRYEFDDYLLRRSGAALRLAEPVEAIERSGENWLINGQYESPILVGAGGHFCPVARRLGARPEVASVVKAQEVEYQADPDHSGGVSPEMPALYFCQDLQGYGWCFRKGDYLNVGLGRLDSDRLSAHVAGFCDFAWERKLLAGERPTKWLGHAYQLYEGPQPRLIEDGVLLVGDAAGLAYPNSGEGIRPAVESGLMAAEVILQAAGNYRRENLAAYEVQLTARLGKARPRGQPAWLPAAWLHWLAGKLLAQRWFCRRVVMDQWFLHAADDALQV